MRFARPFAGLFAATWLLAAEATAQDSSATGNVYGTALDPQGSVLAGAAATLTGPAAAQTTTSDVRGDFHFLSLSPGDYSVTLQREGFETVRRDVTVSPGKNAVLSITLPVAGAAETVIVDSDEVGLDNRTVETGATFGQTELAQIPTIRTPWGVLQQVPGVLFPGVNVGGFVEGPRPIFVGKGSRPDQNSYELDGVPLSLGAVPPFFFDFDSLSNIEVATGGADPELATPGVTLSLVTKRGTNVLRGSARALDTSGVGWDYGVEAGGPLWRDRLWLWAAFAHNDYLTEPMGLSSGEVLRSSVTLAYWNAKLNAELLPANTLTLAYTNFDRTTLGWLLDFYKSDDSNANNARPGQSYIVQDAHVFSDRLFASLNLSYVTNASANTPRGGSDLQAIVDADGIWRHSFWSRFIADDKHQAGLNVSGFFDTGVVRHELKFGFGYRHATFESASSWPGDQIFGNQSRYEPPISRPSRGPPTTTRSSTPSTPSRPTRSEPAISRSPSERASITSRGRTCPRRSPPIRCFRRFFPPCSTAATSDTPSRGARCSRVSRSSMGFPVSARSCAPRTLDSSTSWTAPRSARSARFRGPPNGTSRGTTRTGTATSSPARSTSRRS